MFHTDFMSTQHLKTELQLRGGIQDNSKISFLMSQRFVVVVVALLFCVHGKHLRSWRDGQLTEPHFSWAGLDLLSG